jgi:hypothetical protein
MRSLMERCHSCIETGESGSTRKTIEVEFKGVWFEDELPGSNEGTDWRRDLRINIDFDPMLDLLE